MKKLTAVLILVLIVMLSAAVKSEAACPIVGKIVYAAIANGATYTVYLAPNQTALPTFYYFFTTVDPEVISTLNAAQASNLKVYINGSAGTCPATGVLRFGGTIGTVVVYSLY